MKNTILLFLLLLNSLTFGQKTIEFRISRVYSNVDDMDGWLNDSDPAFCYEVLDNTFGILGEGNQEYGGTNCLGYRYPNDVFFSQQYDCELPASFRFRWRARENDALTTGDVNSTGGDAVTSLQTINIPIANINLAQAAWVTYGTYTNTASGDPCGSGSTVTYNIQLQYRVVNQGPLCSDECIDPYVIPTAAQYDCGSSQTVTPLNIDVNATEPADPSQNSYTMAGITCTYDGASAEDIWVRTTIPDSSGGVTIQFENEGGCTGLFCQTNITYAWYTSSDGTCNGLEYRGCDAVSCFIGCSDGEIQVDGIAGEDVWVRIWEEDDQGFNMTINQISPTAPADRCYTALPLSGYGCNYGATSPTSGLYSEPDIGSWTSAAHPGGFCQDGDMDPLTNTIWSSNENLVWYTYTHAGGDFDLAIDNMSCIGGAASAQVGVFTNSGGPDNPTCDLSTETGYGCSVGVGAVQLSIASLPPGDYIIVVDGNAGAECDWIFTDFIGNTPLPIQLHSFEAELLNPNKVQLEWITMSEKNNDFFTIERSQDGVYWEEIGFVDGAGTSNETIVYTEYDLDPYYGVSYYRIKQTDFDGKQSYSKVESITNKEIRNIKIYPNPANDMLYIEYGVDDDLEVEIYNSLGQLERLDMKNVHGRVSLNVSSLSAGVYMVVLKSEGYTQSEKLVIKH